MFKVKIVREKPTIAVYSRESFFLELFLYHFLMRRGAQVYLIHPQADQLLKQPHWHFFTAHPKLKVISLQEAKEIHSKKIEAFFDLAPLSWGEHLGKSLNEEIEVGYGLINRLSLAVQSETKYILLTPLIYNLASELNFYYQLKNQQLFLAHYAQESQLAYKILQLPNYLYPTLFNQPCQNFLSLLITSFLGKQQIPLSPSTPLYLADIEGIIKEVENQVFGFSSQKEISLIAQPLALSLFLEKVREIFKIEIQPFFQPTSVAFTPLYLGQPLQTQLRVESDFLKLSRLAQENKVRLAFPPRPNKLKIVPLHNDQPASFQIPSPSPIQKEKTKPQKKTRLPHFSFNSLTPPKVPTQLKYFLFAFLFLFLLTSLTFGLLIFSLKKGVFEFESCLHSQNNHLLTGALKSELPQNSSRCLTKTKKYLTLAQKINSSLVPIFQFTGLATTNDRISDIVHFYLSVLNALEKKNSLPLEETAFLNYIFNQDSEGDFSSYYHRLNKKYYLLTTNLDKSIALYRSNQKAYQQVRLWHLNKHFSTTFNYILSWRQKLKQRLVLWQQLPQLLGTTKRQDYLIVLVDNNELRPGGGLITAYAQLTFEGGQLLDLQTFDIYQLDNQLTGEVVPPSPLQEYLGQKSWRIRDAAWQPSYPDTARQIDWFYQKASGQNIDGVILIDDDFLAAMAELWGGFHLQDLNLTLTKNNLRRRLFLWGNLEKGNQNQIFVSLLKTFLSQLKQLKGQQLQTFTTTLDQLAKTKDINFYFNNSQLENLFLDLGWGGEMKTPQCSQNCIVLSGPVIEANLGANRVNYLLSQQLKTEVNITPTLITENLKLTLNNPSSSPRWPGGNYNDYLQWYFEQGWKLEEVKIGGRHLDIDNINVATRSGYHIYSFYHQVGYNQSQTVSLKLSRPFKENSSLDLLFWQPKQIGLTIQKVLYRLNLPQNSRIKVISPVEWKKNNHQIIYQGELNKNILLPVRLKFISF